jgi:hypothetical protein
MKSRLEAVYAVGVAAMLALLLAASPALAECDPETALFDDDFEFLDPSWAQTSDNIYVEDGVLVLKEYGIVNASTLTRAADVCVDMTIAETSDPSLNPIGLVWWWENWDNYYKLLYWADAAYIEVRRFVKGNSTTPVALETLALKQGLGQTNHIEVNLGLKSITISVNGTEVTRFKAKPPKDGGLVGVSSATGTYQFDNFVVNEVAPE